jgi:hypothetical protein
MSVAYLLIAILIGTVTIVALWFYNPVLAIVCAPLAASFLTAIAALAAVIPRRPRRHGITNYSAGIARAH